MSVNFLTDTKYDNKEIPQSNSLVKASKYFGTIEGRLFYLAAMELNPHFPNSSIYDVEFNEIVIPTETIIKVLGGGPNLYKNLVKIASNLLKKTVEIEIEKADGSKEWVGYTIFSRMEFKSKVGLTVKFNNDMKKELLELHTIPYTNVNSRIIFALQSGYAIRLVELMLQYKNLLSARKEKRIERTINIEDLRIFFKIKNQYKSAGDFRIKCIEEPIKEINQATSYKMSYETIKKGKKIVAFYFTMILPDDFEKQESQMATLAETIAMAEQKVTAKKVEKINEILPPEKSITEPLSAEIELIERLKAKGVLKGTSKKWLKQCGYDKMAWVEKYVDTKAKQGSVQKYGAYYRVIIESNEYEITMAENARAEEERRLRQEQADMERKAHIAEQERETTEAAKREEMHFLSLGIDEIRDYLNGYYEMKASWIQSHKKSEIENSIFLKSHDQLIKKYEERLRELLNKKSRDEYNTNIVTEEQPVFAQLSEEQQQQFNDMLEHLLDKMVIK